MMAPDYLPLSADHLSRLMGAFANPNSRMLTFGGGAEPLPGGGGPDAFPQSLFWDNIVFSAIDELPESVVAPVVADSSNPLGGAGGIPSGLIANPEPVPEPGTVVLLGAVGAAALWARRRRR